MEKRKVGERLSRLGRREGGGREKRKERGEGRERKKRGWWSESVSKTEQRGVGRGDSRLGRGDSRLR